MNYIIHAAIGLFLLILQTTGPGRFLPLLSGYDLLIPLILFLGLFRPAMEGIIVATVCGVVMDIYSGGPPGLFVSVYLWLFVSSRWVPRYIHVRNFFFLIVICAVGAGFEAAFLWMGAVLGPGRAPEYAFTLGIMLKSVLSAAITGPVIILFCDRILDMAQKWRARRERFV